MKFIAIPAFALILASASALAQSAPPLKQFLIEREIKGAGDMTASQLRDAAQKSNGVLHALGPDIQWVTAMSPATRSIASTTPPAKP